MLLVLLQLQLLQIWYLRIVGLVLCTSLEQTVHWFSERNLVLAVDVFLLFHAQVGIEWYYGEAIACRSYQPFLIEHVQPENMRTLCVSVIMESSMSTKTSTVIYDRLTSKKKSKKLSTHTFHLKIRCIIQISVNN